mgnify:CR=1 FL=1
MLTCQGRNIRPPEASLDAIYVVSYQLAIS